MQASECLRRSLVDEREDDRAGKFDRNARKRAAAFAPSRTSPEATAATATWKMRRLLAARKTNQVRCVMINFASI